MADMVLCPDCRRLTAVTSRGNLWRHLCGGVWSEPGKRPPTKEDNRG